MATMVPTPTPRAVNSGFIAWNSYLCMTNKEINTYHIHIVSYDIHIVSDGIVILGLDVRVMLRICHLEDIRT